MHDISSILLLSLEYPLVTKELRRLGQGIRAIKLIVKAHPAAALSIDFKTVAKDPRLASKSRGSIVKTSCLCESKRGIKVSMC